MKDIIHYEVKGNKIKLHELIDETKTLQLIMKIKKANISQEQKDFLIKASYRYLDFNYSKIAEYYVNQDKEMQNMMELLGLVVIDYDNAIKRLEKAEGKVRSAIKNNN